MNPTLLNTAMSIAMDWGPSMNKPVHERLKERHPELSNPDDVEYARIGRLAVSLGHDIVYKCPTISRLELASAL